MTYYQTEQCAIYVNNRCEFRVSQFEVYKKFSYLTTFACPFHLYQYKCLPFGTAPVGNMFQCKIDEIFSDMPNVFGMWMTF